MVANFRYVRVDKPFGDAAVLAATTMPRRDILRCHAVYRHP
jgi:hypothetical protein